jgi:hypothetical protein
LQFLIRLNPWPNQILSIASDSQSPGNDPDDHTISQTRSSTNNASVGRITQTLGSTTATSAGGPRVIQLSLRFEF